MDFKLNQSDKDYAARVLNYPLIDSLNSAFVEVATDEKTSNLISDDFRTKIIACRNSDKRELYIRNGITEKFRFVLADFTKVLLLSVRSVYEEESICDNILHHISEFLKTILNATSNQVDLSVDSPELPTAKTLENVIDETVTIVSGRFPLPNPLDAKNEVEDIKILLKENIRLISTLILGIGVARDVHSSVEFSRFLILLTSKLVLKRRVDYGMTDDADQDDSDDDDDESDSDD